MSVTAVLLMGGAGARFQSDIPKQFHFLMGKRVYLYALETLSQSALFAEIILVCHPDYLPLIAGEVHTFPALSIYPGGMTRQESSYIGVQAAHGEFVVVHDAVRPFVSLEILERNVTAVKKHHAVDTCIPSTDTLVYTEGGDKITSVPDRTHYLRGQTPQSFLRSLLLEAHKKGQGKHYSDDCGLVLALGHPIHIVFGDESNLKITSTFDFHLAETLINAANRDADIGFIGNVLARREEHLRP